jgi:hypothetical protein
MLGRLFKKPPEPAPKLFLVAQLNARLQPMHRGEFFEDALDLELKKNQLGEVSGGGTLQAPGNEIEYCDIEIELSGDPSAAERLVIRTLEELGAPKGSKLHVEYEDRKVSFGIAEGLAVYLNGTELADEVYKECDSNFVYSELDRLLQGEGRVLSYWQGPTETAFYTYGRSVETMRSRLTNFLVTYPLCQKCRVVQIA